MAEMCKALEGENMLLQHHLNGLNGVVPQQQQLQRASSVTISPSLPPTSPPFGPTGFARGAGTKRNLDIYQASSASSNNDGRTYGGQFTTLLEAATGSATGVPATSSYNTTDGSNPYSSGSSFSGDESECHHSSEYNNKRRRQGPSSSSVPQSISTTTNVTSSITA
jgi:hypothetical protein